MTSTTMRFGPEWMRKQPASAKSSATSPPPSSAFGGNSLGAAHAPPGTASYSALVTPHLPPAQGKRDVAHPFKYSRDEMLQVYKNLGACSELPIEVERWEGIVRESATEPVSLSDLTEIEKKLYATSVNSEMRRRQPSDYAVQGDRPKGGTMNIGVGLMGRRRRGDSNGAEHPPLTLPRKASWSSTPGNLVSPSAASPRSRMIANDGATSGSHTAWGGTKRRAASGKTMPERLEEEEETKNIPRHSGSNADSNASEVPGGSWSEQDVPATRNDTLQESGGVQELGGGADARTTASAMNKLSLNDNLAPPRGLDRSDGAGSKPVDGTDLTKVEWSYIDPSGVVQGPFPGETMQRWNDQQYFTDNLLMKRTHVDSEFMPLAEIKRRAQGDRIFLSPLSDNAPPPGLGHAMPGAGLTSFLHRTGIIDAPRQPSPQSYGRSNAMDAIINGSSMATGSGSPSSSFGGSMARGPLSPDPMVVGSRLQQFVPDVTLNGRVSAAGSYSSHGSPAIPQVARQFFNEPQPNRSSSFDTPPNAHWQMPEGHNTPTWNGTAEVPRLSQLRGFEQSPQSSFGTDHLAGESSQFGAAAGMSPMDPSLSSSIPSMSFPGQTSSLRSPYQQIPHDQSFENAASLPQLDTSLNRGFEHQPASPAVSSSFHLQTQMRHTPPLSPWGAAQPREPQRPSPFDAERPTSQNTFVVSLPQTHKPQAEVHSHDPWTSRQSFVQNDQNHLAQEPQSLTTANVNLHNEQQNLQEPRSLDVQYPTSPVNMNTPKRSQVGIAVVETAPEAEHKPSFSVSSPVREPAAQGAGGKRKGSIASAIPAERAKPTNAVPVSPVPATPQKPAWSADDGGRPKASGVALSLRDIQEAEKKKQDARKTVEKERERAARATSTASPTQEVQYTASWGLPTSQAGTRNGISAANEPPVSPPGATAPTPAWTSAARPSPTTMKEIQEEEERRKQAVKERETAASAAKKAATQSSVAKAPAASAPSSGGIWTVVGSGGKTQTAASIVAARPGQTATPRAQAASSRPTASQRPANSPSIAKAAPSTTKVEEEPNAPSLEFMKWMRDSLRGLNNSVQFEEIAQMLLSFPLNPDKATKEIIAETVYGASTTLNGHDFAEEFIKKRKEDAASRGKGANGSANGKPVSLADVVKTQPKGPQNDFGAFKVVKKKNKRS